MTSNTTEPVLLMSADALRGYLVTVRRGLRLSQTKFGKAIGLSRRAVIDYETGKTEDLKAELLLRAMAVLQVPFQHLKELAVRTTKTEGEALAKEWLKRASKDDLHQMTNEELVERLSVLDSRLETVLARLQHDPQLVAQIRAYALGLTDASALPAPGDTPEQ